MKKNILLLLGLFILGAVLIKGTNFQTVEEFYLLNLDQVTEESQVVSFSIRVDTILDNYEDLKDNLRSEEYVPLNGVILEKMSYVLRPKDTVFDLLLRITRHHQIQMEYQGADLNQFGSIYVQGINHLYEFSCGKGSGWSYLVNGKYPQYGSSIYEPTDGDDIMFVYTCNFGRDLERYLIQEGEE